MAPESAVAGSCLCGEVRFEITPPSTAFRYCHCTRCRKVTGAAHAANLFVPAAQFRWLSGESQARRYDLPGAKRFAVSFCTRCGTRVPHRVTGTENMLIPAGVLDGMPDLRPEGSIFWNSRAGWFIETPALPKHGEYGR
ncbi:MAG: GFA family protein [Burkholderiales bacterium]|nr:GFA family protein [Burkholderiales bacterium]